MKDETMLLPVRVAAVRALRAQAAEEAIEPLVDLLNHASFQIKVAVSSTLVCMGDRRGEKTLKEQIKSKDLNVRREAAMTIATMDQSLIDHIKGLKKDERNGLEMLFEDLYQEGYSIYDFSVLALVQLGNQPQVLQRLQNALSDAHVLVRAAAVETLARLGQKSSPLRERLGDYHEFVRLKAVEAMQRLEAREALSQLQQMAAHDPDADVRQAAQRAVGKLSTA